MYTQGIQIVNVKLQGYPIQMEVSQGNTFQQIIEALVQGNIIADYQIDCRNVKITNITDYRNQVIDDLSTPVSDLRLKKVDIQISWSNKKEYIKVVYNDKTYKAQLGTQVTINYLIKILKNKFNIGQQELQIQIDGQRIDQKIRIGSFVGKNNNNIFNLTKKQFNSNDLKNQKGSGIQTRYSSMQQINSSQEQFEIQEKKKNTTDDINNNKNCPYCQII